MGPLLRRQIPSMCASAARRASQLCNGYTRMGNWWPVKTRSKQHSMSAGSRCDTATKQPVLMDHVDVEGKSQHVSYYLQVRPSPFVVRLKASTDDGVGEMQIAVNARTMVNRALADLPHESGDKISVSWRVVPHDDRIGAMGLRPFNLTSNRSVRCLVPLFLPDLVCRDNTPDNTLDCANLTICACCRGDLPPQQPPHFTKYLLRPEQLRSLGWMLQQARTET